jgi:ABC-type transporter Mla subunit MlaD
MRGLSSLDLAMSQVELVDFNNVTARNSASLKQARDKFARAAEQIQGAMAISQTVVQNAPPALAREMRKTSSLVKDLLKSIDAIKANVGRGSFPSQASCATSASLLSDLYSIMARNASKVR